MRFVGLEALIAREMLTDVQEGVRQ